jgi:hypothetical protein
MSTLPKLIRGGGTAFERELLSSLRDDVVPPSARARVAAGLGIGAPYESLGHDPLEAASAAARAAATNGAGSGARQLELATLGKYALLIAAGFAASSWQATGAAGSARGALESELVAVQTIADQIMAGQVMAALPLPEAVEPPSALERSAAARTDADGAPPAQDRSGSRRAAPRAKPPSRSAMSAHGDAQSALMEEVQRLDAVRAALRRSEPQEALGGLDRYDADFARGELRLEAAVLRVQALRDSGAVAAATRLARRTLAEPGSERYRARLGELIPFANLAGSFARRRDIGEARSTAWSFIHIHSYRVSSAPS